MTTLNATKPDLDAPKQHQRQAAATGDLSLTTARLVLEGDASRVPSRTPCSTQARLRNGLATGTSTSSASTPRPTHARRTSSPGARSPSTAACCSTGSRPRAAATPPGSTSSPSASSRYCSRTQAGTSLVLIETAAEDDPREQRRW